MKIVTGKGEKDHVTAEEHRKVYEGIIGSGSCILSCGEKMVPSLISNNLLRVRSGEMIHHGNISSVKNYDDVELTNGTQGMKRIDLVVSRYTKNAETEIESSEWVVIVGIPAEVAPVAPEYVAGDLRAGDLVDDCPVFEIYYDGLNVLEVKQLIPVSKTIEELEKENAELDNNKICFPDFSNEIEKHDDEGFTASSDGWLYILAYSGWTSTTISVNGVEVFNSQILTTNDYPVRDTAMMPIKKGDIIAINSVSDQISVPTTYRVRMRLFGMR